MGKKYRKITKYQKHPNSPLNIILAVLLAIIP